ncbi:MAG TPA: glycosyltransferase family 2 protein [Reyranella sp.]|jgi:cellulose synthase/poly-beta-1,6-N-acetylglucosamine synthase-like glycosyltransferase|nr:glycosyltransferase family 2 protein [Reyranella sp.]
MLLFLVDLAVVLCLALQLGIAGYFFYLLYWLAGLPRREERPPPLPDELPQVLVQIPVYNEPAVVERAAKAAGMLDWPRDRLKIQILDDSTDLTPDIVRHAVGRLRGEGIDADHVRRHDRAGFKAGALAAGMALCDAPYVAVFDADFVPPADWLRRAMATLLATPRAAFAQTRIEWGNGDRTWLTRAQRLMQDAHFAVEQDVRARRGVPFQFNGTGGIWRRAAVEDAGGWSHDTLSEDLDLVLRTHLGGWTGVFLMEPHVVGELPQQLADFGAQQSRWSKGFVQVARKLLPQVWGSNWSAEAKLITTAALGQQLIFPVLAIGIVALILSILGHGQLLPVFGAMLWVWLVLVLVVLVGMTWGAYRRLKRGGMLGYLMTAVTVPALIVYLAVANAGAIVAAGLGRKTEFKRTPKTGA